MKKPSTEKTDRLSIYIALLVDIVEVVVVLLVILAIVAVNSNENDMFSASAVVIVTIMAVFL